jgi:hypothetical protein
MRHRTAAVDASHVLNSNACFEAALNIEATWFQSTRANWKFACVSATLFDASCCFRAEALPARLSKLISYQGDATMRYYNSGRRINLLLLIVILLLVRLMFRIYDVSHRDRHVNPPAPQAVPTQTVQPDSR